MEIAAIAAATIPALIPYLVKGSEKIAEKIAVEGFEQRGKIWGLVKGLFQGDELIQLDLFAENPNDPKLQGKIEGKLEEKLKGHEDIAKQIAELLQQFPSIRKTNSLSIVGDGNKTAQDITNSTVTIS
jgi:hypothetical protein